MGETALHWIPPNSRDWSPFWFPRLAQTRASMKTIATAIEVWASADEVDTDRANDAGASPGNSRVTERPRTTAAAARPSNRKYATITVNGDGRNRDGASM